MEGLQTYEELQANLKEYQSQQQQVEQLLLLEPENEELQDMYNSLQEVITLTEDLLRDAREQHAAAAAAAAPPAIPPVAPAPQLSRFAPIASTSAITTPLAALAAAGLPSANYQIVTPPALNIPSILPASVAEQIRRAQIKAALSGQAPAAWAVGAPCQALYSADNEWYDATIEAATSNGNFIVVYDGYGTKEEVKPGSIKPRPETKEVYRGVSAPKRKRVEDEPVVTEIPKWLEIKETDDEKTRARKKKLMKSYKSKMRFQAMDMATKEKQSNWQSFLKGKGSKSKAGYFSSRKKDSIFKVPDNGKVGVVGSGKGMTDYQKRQRHEFTLDE